MYVAGNGKDGNMIELAQSNLGPKLSTNSSRSVAQALGGSGSCDTAASTSGLISQSASGFLSVSEAFNGRPASVTSSGFMSHMVSTLNADVARAYLEKVADLLLEFSRGDAVVKSHMCSLSLLIRLFQMLNKLEAPILLKVINWGQSPSGYMRCLKHSQHFSSLTDINMHKGAFVRSFYSRTSSTG